MNLDLKEFHAAFFEEAAEHLTTLEEGLLKLEASPDDKELINGIFRSAHSIKGTGGALGFGEIAAFTHDLETVLDRMRNGEMLATATRVELLLRATDALLDLCRYEPRGHARAGGHGLPHLFGRAGDLDFEGHQTTAFRILPDAHADSCPCGRGAMGCAATTSR